jgi:hypothetical protein
MIAVGRRFTEEEVELMRVVASTGLIRSEPDVGPCSEGIDHTFRSFAITPSARNKLTSKRMKANNRDTCQPFFCL